MSKWIFKAALQRAISWLPQNHKWNALFQRYVTKGLYVSPSSFENKLDNCRTHFENYRKYSPQPRDAFKVLELGTGWWPIPPIGLYLCGAEEIWTYDIVPLLRQDTFNRVLQLFLEYHQDGRLGRMLPGIRPDRASQLPQLVSRSLVEAPAAVLASLKINVLIRDARQTGLPAGSIDLVYSNACFEHIPLSVQEGLYAEFKRVAAQNSVMSHFIGIGDQYSNFDRSISMFNYLKFTAKQWRFFDNSIIPQTRLRACDYRRAIEQAGYEVVMQRNIDGPKEELAKITLAPEFRHYSQEDLLACYTWLVARPM